MSAVSIIHHVGLGGSLLVIALGVALGLVAELGRRPGSRSWAAREDGKAEGQYFQETGGYGDLARTEPLDMRGELER